MDKKIYNWCDRLFRKENDRQDHKYYITKGYYFQRWTKTKFVNGKYPPEKFKNKILYWDIRDQDRLFRLMI